jgi:regulatory protein
MPIAVRYLARRDRTVAQVERFLTHKGATTSEVRGIITRLSQLCYLDDRAYAERWIEARLARYPMGRVRLEAELLAQGVAETLAGQAIHKALRSLDEKTLARRALCIMSRAGRGVTPGRAMRLLRQRGFEDETVEHIMRGFLNHEDLDR